MTRKCINNHVIIGSSKGLGAALVEELLKDTSNLVIGVARTRLEDVLYANKWELTGRYRHLQLDVSSSQCHEVLHSFAGDFSSVPLCIIYNAAIINSDINNDGTIKHCNITRINEVGIIGLCNVIKAFESHLTMHGGTFVGISSFSALFPPVNEPKLAYPATKAYMDMFLRCLSKLWDKKVKVLVVHLGHIHNNKSFSTCLIKSNYPETARFLVKTISNKKHSCEVNYPLIYTLFYKYLFKFLPVRLYFWLLKTFSRHHPTGKYEY